MDSFSTIIPVLTALMGAALTYFVQRDITARSQRWSREEMNHQVLIDRGEELFSLAHNWQRAAGSEFLMYRRVMTGDIDYNQAFDSIIENSKRILINFDRIQLILGVYFPELKNEFSNLHRKVLLATKIEANFRIHYKNGNFDASRHLPVYEQLMTDAEKLTEEFLDSLAEVLRKRIGAGMTVA